MSIAAEKLPLPHHDVRKKSYRAAVATRRLIKKSYRAAAATRWLINLSLPHRYHGDLLKNLPLPRRHHHHGSGAAAVAIATAASWTSLIAKNCEMQSLAILFIKSYIFS
jgi:hypothetical protein